MGAGQQQQQQQEEQEEQVSCFLKAVCTFTV